MARVNSLLILALASLTLAVVYVSAQTSAPDELRKVDPSDPQNQQQQQQRQQQPGVTPISDPPINDETTTPYFPLPTNNLGQDSNNNNNQLVPTSDNDDDGDNDDDDDDKSEGNVFPFDPLGLFGPRPPRPNGPNGPNGRPFGPGSLFSFLQDPFRQIDRHRQMMDQQFRQLEKQAVEGQSTSFFTRNGVGYKKVCTIERIGQDQQQQKQPQDQQQQQQQEQQKQ